MKYYNLFIFIGMVMLSFGACSKILDENPRSELTPNYFKSAQGLRAGIIVAYNGLRYISGNENIMNATLQGTDEFTAATGAGSIQLDMDPNNNGSAITSGTPSINIPWNQLFPYINTCNGIIEFGAEAGLDNKEIAEAYFLRAYYYFLMVQMYGGVPLDLGSGPLKFNVTPTTLSARSTQEEVYAAIISDLQFAEANLPIASADLTANQRGRTPGNAFRAAAVHFLAKVYLTHGDNQLALTEAEKLLNPTSPYTAGTTYGKYLQSIYYEVIRPTNERNAEILFTCEHTTNYGYNETAAGYGSGTSNKDDRSCSYFVPAYQTAFTLGRTGDAGFLQRTLEYSRPWDRMRPTAGCILNTFADKTNDSRFDASFQTVWRNNGATQNGLLNQPLRNGDTAFVMLSYEVSAAYRASKNYRIYTPSQFTRGIYPALKKFFDPNRLDPNDACARPFLLAKLSETYLIAAEAALKLGDNTKARDYILILRKRAAKTGHEQDMIDATPATITIDYILDERTRELCGEQMRWFDLKRTGKWRERSATYSLDGTTIRTRDIRNYYDLRPIPNTQFDLMGNTAEEKAAYQNPGY